jgi:hypothetical protein
MSTDPNAPSNLVAMSPVGTPELTENIEAFGLTASVVSYVILSMGAVENIPPRLKPHSLYRTFWHG